MRQIQLTQGKAALVGDADFEWLNQWKWLAWKGHNTFYAARNPAGGHKGRKLIFMHRQILDCKDDEQGDHEDHNGLNNQRYNLRICTHTQNLYNKIPRGKSKYLGVEVRKSGMFHARIRIDKIRVYLGSFETEEAAAKAYDIAAKKHHKEFANLNFKEIKRTKYKFI